GSHIRTLLLTFFFRQMREIIERGHLFIAQPPLFKVAETKRRSIYLKDEDEYQRYLIERVQRDWRLVLGDNGAPPLAGLELGHFLARVESYRENLQRLVGRGIPGEAVEIALQEGLRLKEDLGRTEVMRAVADRLAEVDRFSEVEVRSDEEHGTEYISFSSRQDGVDRTVSLDWNLLATGEYRSLAQNEQGQRASVCRRFLLSRGEEQEETSELSGLDEVLDKLFDGAKKGITIQRYKGLGEMNADQLWETTMDPEVRNLLRVRIEDAVAADQIFSILMGDHVEPRRDFIVENALEVKNLDV
ncbi:MAG: hypothetical protein MI919_03895, partial [Holophagales bacterium]|nr:hypothetical protein [Holophagales bacterium]